MATVAQLQSVVQKYSDFKNSIQNGQTALQNVITVGTVLYTDAAFAAVFPNSVTAYKAYLLQVQSAINTFVSSFPAEPTLNG